MSVYSYFAYGCDYFWNEDTGIPEGIKATYSDHFEIERFSTSIQDVIVEFIETLARFDFGFIVRIDSNDVVAILEEPGLIKLRAESNSLYGVPFLTQRYVYHNDGVHLNYLISEPLDIV